MTKIWSPSCNLQSLQLRAAMLKKIRRFFDNKSVLEVETPLLCQATGTDPQLDFFSSDFHSPPHNQTRYLQTSPEFAMKRLLAAETGCVYQICKAFRNGETGRLHNPEFTILEWYRVGYSLDQLMDEVIELLKDIASEDICFEAINKISYQQLFEQMTGLNPLNFCRQDYETYAIEHNIADAISLCGNEHSMWLDFIFSYKVQPLLTKHSVTLVYGYPAIQASLARINQNNPAVADRFELFIGNIEIGNGFFELADANEQEQRFDKENIERADKNLPLVAKDQLFIDALKSGIPDCSGIAIGLDRLLMVLAGGESINDVLAFPFERA